MFYTGEKDRKAFIESLPDQLYIVQLADPPHTVQQGLPTPRLIQDGEALAYFVKDENGSQGIWYKKDVGYTSPDGNYIKVRVFRNPSL